MKKILTLTLMTLAALTLYSQEPAKTKAELKAEAKAAKQEEKLQKAREGYEEILKLHTFDFNATYVNDTYNSNKSNTSGNIEFYRGYTSFSLPKFRNERTIIGGYLVVPTEKGWLVSFNAKNVGLDGNIDVDGGGFGLFTFRMEIDLKGNATLTVSTNENDHKYPFIFSGYITANRN